MDTRSHDRSRREALSQLVFGALLLIATPAARAARRDDGSDLPHLSEDDTLARQLAYVHDAAQADAARTPDSFCHNCRYFKGESKQPWAGCQLFPNVAVNAGGWCNVWAAKQN